MPIFTILWAIIPVITNFIWQKISSVIMNFIIETLRIWIILWLCIFLWIVDHRLIEIFILLRWSFDLNIVLYLKAYKHLIFDSFYIYGINHYCYINSNYSQTLIVFIDKF